MNSKNIQATLQGKFEAIKNNAHTQNIFQKKLESILNFLYETPKRNFMKPGPFRLGNLESEWALKGMSYDLFLEKFQKNIRVYQFGSAQKTILFMHGWGGRGLQLSPLIQPLLELDYQVVLFDVTGHGESEGTGSTYFEFVESLRAVNRKYSNVEGIVAHSMGCGAATVLASEKNSEFKTVLIAPHYDMKAEFLRWAQKVGAPASILKGFIRLSEMRFDYKFDDLNTKNITHLLKGPVLLIHDIEDKAANFKSSEALHAAINQSKLLKTEGKGHNKILSDRDIAHEIKSFFSEEKTGVTK